MTGTLKKDGKGGMGLFHHPHMSAHTYFKRAAALAKRTLDRAERALEKEHRAHDAAAKAAARLPVNGHGGGMGLFFSSPSTHKKHATLKATAKRLATVAKKSTQQADAALKALETVRRAAGN